MSNDRPPSGGERRPIPRVIWTALAFVVVALFIAVLWMLNPPSANLGKGRVDMIAPGQMQKDLPDARPGAPQP
jgi:hypothetical protein